MSYIFSIIWALTAFLTVNTAYASLRSTFKQVSRPYVSEIKEKVDAKTAQVKGRASEKKDKIISKAKAKGDKIKNVFGIDTIVRTVSGKDVETAESLLIRLDNMVSAETIIKMIKLMQADMKFQLDKRQARFDQAKMALEKMLADVESKMADARNKVGKKIQENIDKYNAAIRGNKEVIAVAQATLEQNNSALLTVINGIDAFTQNNIVHGMRDAMVKAVATSKLTAQKDLIRYNNDIDAIQKKLDKAQDELEKAMTNPNFAQQMSNLAFQSNVIVEALGKLLKNYEDFRESDFFNYFDSEEVKYQTNLDSFSKAAGCSLNLDSHSINVMEENSRKLTACKNNIINGIPNKPEVRYLKQDVRFSSLPQCSALNEASDIVDVEQCIVNYGGISLTSFGDPVVPQ